MVKKFYLFFLHCPPQTTVAADPPRGPPGRLCGDGKYRSRAELLRDGYIIVEPAEHEPWPPRCPATGDPLPGYDLRRRGHACADPRDELDAFLNGDQWSDSEDSVGSAAESESPPREMVPTAKNGCESPPATDEDQQVLAPRSLSAQRGACAVPTMSVERELQLDAFLNAELFPHSEGSARAAESSGRLPALEHVEGVVQFYRQRLNQELAAGGAGSISAGSSGVATAAARGERGAERAAEERGDDVPAAKRQVGGDGERRKLRARVDTTCGVGSFGPCWILYGSRFQHCICRTINYNH